MEGDAAWPDLSDAALIAAVQDWLAPHLHGLTRLAELAALDLPAILLGMLDWDARRRLDAALPARVPLPAGRSAAVDYTRDVPTMEARAQHLYGMAALPRARRRRRAAPGGGAVAGRATDRRHRRPRRVLAGRLGGGAQGDARPLPQARLA